MREPARPLHDRVEQIPVQHQQSPPVGGVVDRLFVHLDAAERQRP